MAAAEQEASDSHWKSLLNDYLDRHQNFVDPRTALPNLLNTLPVGVKDSAIAGVLMTRRVNDCKDYDQWLESVQEAREKASRCAAAGQGSSSPHPGGEGTAGTGAPQAPLPEAMEEVDPAATVRVPEPLGPPDGGTTNAENYPKEVDPEEAAVVRELIAQSLAEAERAEREAGRPVAVPAFTVEVGTPDHPGTVASVYGGKKQIVRRYDRLPEVPPEGEMNVFDPERTLQVAEPVEETPEERDLLAGSLEREETASPPEGPDRSSAAEADLPSAGGTKPEEDLPAGAAAAEVAPSRGGSGKEGNHEELWQQVLVRLEQEEQGLPLFNRASLRWEGKKAVLLAPRIAVAWALQSQEERIQAHLRHLTGQEVAVQVRAGPGVSCGRV